MDSPQVIYPTIRLLGNPKIFVAIERFFEEQVGTSPEWDVFASAFYDLMEAQFEDVDAQPEFTEPEICFRIKPEEPSVFQVILSNGDAIELRPGDDGDNYKVVASEDDLAVVSAIYGRLVKAIEKTRPDLKGDISLTDIPSHGNGFLRDIDGDAFRGSFTLLSNPETKFNFVVNVIDLETDDLRAEVSPAL